MIPKLIASDIDGTMLPPGGTNPSQELTDVLTKYLDAGAVVALASGRPLSGLDCLFPSLKDRLLYICSNGTQIVKGGKTLFLSPVAAGDELRELMEVVRALHCEFMVDTAEVTLTEGSVSEPFFQSIKAAGIHVKKIPDIAAIDTPALKISIAHPNGPLSLLREPSIARLADKYTLVPTGGIFFDIIGKNADKGTAVATVQRHFGIKPEETVVFGDAMNDIPMFETTPNGYAVETSPKVVKDHASKTILPPEQDGLAKCLRDLLH